MPHSWSYPRTIPMTSYHRSQPERSTYVDQQTGRTVEQLTSSPMADLHTYYDISPWSPDGRYMVFSAAIPSDVTTVHRDTLATESGRLYLMDLGDIRVAPPGGKRFLQHPYRRFSRLASH